MIRKLSAIYDDAWMRKQLRNLWLDGDSQEQISKKLEISVGTVNRIIQDLTSKDQELVLMREISLSAKKNGVDIPQIAANLRYKNAITRLGLDNDKLEVCLNALGSILSENDITPKIFSELFYDICSVMLKERKSLSQTADEVKYRKDKINELDLRIDEKKKMAEDAEVLFKRTIESNNLNIEKMNQIMEMKTQLEFYGINFDELMDLRCVLRNVRKLSRDPKTIVNKYTEIAIAETEVAELNKNFKKLLSICEAMDNYAENKKQATKILTRLFRRGISEQDLLIVLDIIELHIENMTILQLSKDIDTYGSISAVNSKLLMERSRLRSHNGMLRNSMQEALR